MRVEAGASSPGLHCVAGPAKGDSPGSAGDQERTMRLTSLKIKLAVWI